MSYRHSSWLDMMTNMFALVVVCLLVIGVTNSAMAAKFADDPSYNNSDVVAFVSAAQLIDSVSRDARALEIRYLEEVAIVDSLIHYKLTQKVGMGIRFDGTSQDDILEPTFFMGFKTRW